MNIPTEKKERQKLAQNLLKNAGLFCDEVPELLENWILYRLFAEYGDSHLFCSSIVIRWAEGDSQRPTISQ